MRYAKLFLVLGITAGLTWLLNSNLQIGDTKLPPLGKFFSPFHGFWQNAEPVKEHPSGTLDIPGLLAPVSVYYDDRLVPHVFAEDIQDAARVQGYLHARHRLWQMDIAARSSAGRLSEILGATTLEIDRLQRRKGMLLAAEQAVEGWKEYPNEFALIEAFCEGVNLWIDRLHPRDYPLEFKLLNYKPERWTPLHSALVAKSMSTTLCSKNEDLEATNTLAWLGEEVYDRLFPESFSTQRPVIPPGTVWDFKPIQVEQSDVADTIPDLEMMGVLPYPEREQIPVGIGSNNWVLSGARTASGYPILANDPHLQLTLPSIWYEIQLHLPEFNAYGVSLPGIPGMLIGFNEDVAWGVTNVGQDVLDWYRIDWADRQQRTYRVDGELLQAMPVVEIIRVRGQQAVTDTVLYTEFGPIVYSQPDNPAYDLAMRWIAHDRPQSSEIGTFLEFMQSKNHNDFLKASYHHHQPAQNFIFASRDGDIALRVSGRFPLRTEGQGRFVQEGNTRANQWNQFIPAEHTPRALNPEQGHLSSANQHSAPPDYPYYFHGYFDEYRGRLVNRLLDEAQGVGVEEMKAMQNNNYSILAEEALPGMMRWLDETQLNTNQLGLLELLRDWNYRFDAEKKAAVLFDIWYKTFYRNLWDEFYTRKTSHPVILPDNSTTVDILLNDPTLVFWDDQRTPEREGPAEILTRSFIQMADALQEELKDPAYNWGQHWKLDIRHLARIPAFSMDGLTPGGHPEALNAIRNPNGPSWRMIVELGPEIKAYGVYPGGQSGNPGSPYYNSMVETWLKGEYHTLQFYKSPAEAAQRSQGRIEFTTY
jgi:penicillin amidase